MDFQKSSAKAIKKVFPRIYLIKCFFHFIQSMHKHIIKLKLNKNENKNEIFEILFNIKLLSFVKPENIPLIYKKIKKKYNNKKFADFFNYFEKNWNPNFKYRKMEIISKWNYYNLINSIEIDIKYLYLTNNVAEYINKILNSKFNTKFPNFESWKNAIISTEK